MDMKKFTKNRWLLVVLIIGIVCLLFGSSLSRVFQRVTPAVASVAGGASGSNNAGGGEEVDYTPAANQSLTASQSIDAYYDEQLTNILLKISGINAVTVMVTVSGSQTETVAQNTQTTTTTDKSANGGTSNSTSVSTNVVSESGASGSAPIIISTSEPAVQGVLVTVAATDFAVARSEIIDAIQNVLDMPAYKISVEPQKVN